jgi:tRNA(adenine34) deaminase
LKLRATIMNPHQGAGSMPPKTDIEWMKIALEQADAAADSGEVPVGALVISGGEIVGRGNNRNLRENDPTAHAEMVALREAAARVGNHRLLQSSLYCTIEPCAMCAGAMIHARIARLVYGAHDPKAGAAGSVLEVVNHPKLNHKMEVISRVLEDECAEVLRKFFQERRKT